MVFSRNDIHSKYSENIKTTKLLLLLFISLFPWQLNLSEAIAEINFISLYESEEGSVSIKEGTIHVYPYTNFKVALLGSDLNSSLISFSLKGKSRDSLCSNDRETEVQTIQSDVEDRAIVTLNFKVAENSFLSFINK